MRTTTKLMLGTTSILVLAMTGCGPGPAAGEHGHRAADEVELKLDGGRKWMADQNTADSVARMDELVAKSPARSPTASLGDYTRLGTELQEAVNGLIRGCRMTGPAHEQLHLYLGGFFPQVKALAEAKDPAAAKEALAHVTQLLRVFHQFFDAPS